MTQFVIDSSAALRFDGESYTGSTYFAPELIDVELANALRKVVLRGGSVTDANRFIADWSKSAVVRTSHAPLMARVWELRHNITPYDATYVALAESMALPLITADRRLAAAAAPYCDVIALP